MDDDDLNRQLEAWVARLSTELGIDRAVVDVAGVLALAGEAAHAIVRPAAPVTAFVVGYAAGLAAGRGAAASEALAGAAATARRLCAEVAAP